MTKEQILEIIRRHQVYRLPLDKKDYEILNNNIADEILSLPIDVPTDEEIKKMIKERVNWSKTFVNGAVYGAELMRDEILKRNK